MSRIRLIFPVIGTNLTGTDESSSNPDEVFSYV
jgi:hypothetical protein